MLIEAPPRSPAVLIIPYLWGMIGLVIEFIETCRIASAAYGIQSVALVPATAGSQLTAVDTGRRSTTIGFGGTSAW